MDTCTIGDSPYQDGFKVSWSSVDKYAVFRKEKIGDKRQTVGLKCIIWKQGVYLHELVIMVFNLLCEIISDLGSIKIK